MKQASNTQGSRWLQWVATPMMAWLALITLIVPGSVAVVDHHAAERLPGHAHIFLGQFDATHVHGAGAGHTHTVVGADAGGVASVFDTGEAACAVAIAIGLADFADPLSYLSNIPWVHVYQHEAIAVMGRSVGPLENPPEA